MLLKLFGRLGVALMLIVGLVACVTTDNESQPEAVTNEASTQEAGVVSSTHWLQPDGHTADALAEAYGDGILDEKDSVYWKDDLPTKAWKQAPLRDGRAGDFHGYRKDWIDLELLVVEQNSKVTELALGKYPSEYAWPILEGVRQGTIKRAKCDAAHLRFGETGWIPPGLYPIRDMNGKFVGHAKMVVAEIDGQRHPQTIVPLNEGVAVVVVPMYPIERQLTHGSNPEARWGVIHDGKHVPLEFLPKGNVTNRLVSAPENERFERKNELLSSASSGALLMVAIVKPGICSGEPSVPS